MKIFKYSIFALLAIVALGSCSDDDDNGNVIEETCNDGIMNQDETGVDCGGSTCDPCETMNPDPDFSGTFNQIDIMGRAGVNTVYGNDDMEKNAFNLSFPNEQVAEYQDDFSSMITIYHDVYSQALFGDDESIDYETNILGLDLPTFSTVLAFDVLQVAVDGPTVYFDPGTDNDNDGSVLVPDGDETILTGRRIQDDVVDVALILTFGGMSGEKFDGTVQLTSDGVGFDMDGGHTPDAFPYLGAPNN